MYVIADFEDVKAKHQKNATVSGMGFRILRDTHGWFMKKHAKIEDVEVEKWWRWKITLYNKRLW